MTTFTKHKKDIIYLLWSFIWCFYTKWHKTVRFKFRDIQDKNLLQLVFVLMCMWPNLLKRDYPMHLTCSCGQIKKKCSVAS